MTDDANFKPGTAAKVVCDSVSPDGVRCTTMEVTFHRFVLAEFNTHRVFSRNSASSRAIPFHKQVARVRENPAIPVSFPAEQRGMQGGEELRGEAREAAVKTWLAARDATVEHATHLASPEYLSELEKRGYHPSVHKSVVNRLLEPFMWHTVIVTSVDYQNFFDLRSHPMAQPEIRVASELMEDAYAKSVPADIGYGEYHTPYITEEDYDAAGAWLVYSSDGGRLLGREYDARLAEVLRQVSAARCARVSYLTHDGRRDIEADITLYKRLTENRPPHASPLEHVARPQEWSDPSRGNLPGWVQFRHELEDRIDG